MAVPTIASLTPSIGLASGGSLVSIVGTGFNPPTDALSGVVNSSDPMDPVSLSAVTQTAQVLFDGVLSPQVWVRSSTLIEALTPPGNAGGVTQAPPGRTVSVQVINVVQGTTTPIGGESVTLENAFTCARPLLTKEYESGLSFAIRTLLQLMTGQLLIGEINWAVQTDYDSFSGDELHVTKFAKLPGIVLVGPDLEENRFYSTNQQPDFPDGSVDEVTGLSAGFLETRVPYTVDISFDVIGASNNKLELMGLAANFVMFMHANKYLYVLRNPSDPTKGQARFEMDFVTGRQPKNVHLPNNSNVVSWSSKIVIRGFNIEAFSGLLTDGTSDPLGLVPAHAVVEHGRRADIVSLSTTQEDD